MQSRNISEAETNGRDLERISRLVVAGQLVAAVAHDLRQPLTAIEMNISAAVRLLATCLDGSAAAATSAVVGKAESALHDALGELGRMRVALQVLEDLARHRDPAFASVDLVGLVRDVVRLVASEISPRTKIELKPATVVSPIMADGTLVRQALLNVLIHALECTSSSDHPGGPITIAVQSHDDDSVELAVTHFGEREETQTSPEPTLALARSIAQAHSAPLTILGDPTGGVTIAIRWPVRQTVADHGQE